MTRRSPQGEKPNPERTIQSSVKAIVTANHATDQICFIQIWGTFQTWHRCKTGTMVSEVTKETNKYFSRWAKLVASYLNMWIWCHQLGSPIGAVGPVPFCSTSADGWEACNNLFYPSERGYCYRYWGDFYLQWKLFRLEFSNVNTR